MHYEIDELLSASGDAVTASMRFTPDARIYKLEKGSTIQNWQFTTDAHSRRPYETDSGAHEGNVQRSDVPNLGSPLARTSPTVKHAEAHLLWDIDRCKKAPSQQASEFKCEPLIDSCILKTQFRISQPLNENQTSLADTHNRLCEKTLPDRCNPLTVDHNTSCACVVEATPTYRLPAPQSLALQSATKANLDHITTNCVSKALQKFRAISQPHSPDQNNHTGLSRINPLQYDSEHNQLDFINCMLQKHRKAAASFDPSSEPEKICLQFTAAERSFDRQCSTRRLNDTSSQETDAASLEQSRWPASQDVHKKRSISAMISLARRTSCDALYSSSRSLRARMTNGSNQSSVELSDTCVRQSESSRFYNDSSALDDKHGQSSHAGNDVELSNVLASCAGWGTAPRKALAWSETGPKGTAKEDYKDRQCSRNSTTTWSTADGVDRVCGKHQEWEDLAHLSDIDSERILHWLSNILPAVGTSVLP